MTPKAVLRRQALAARDAIPEPERARASRAITARALPLVRAVSPGVIAAFVPIRSEYDPRPVVEMSCAEGAQLALPAIFNGAMTFRLHRPGATLVSGPLGTVSPERDAPIVDPDVIVVPVAGFDRAGTRLGYGKGYYDGAIAALIEKGRRPRLIGVAFAAQEVDRIAHEPHDVALDFVVTEAEVIDFHRPPD